MYSTFIPIRHRLHYSLLVVLLFPFIRPVPVDVWSQKVSYGGPLSYVWILLNTRGTDESIVASVPDKIRAVLGTCPSVTTIDHVPCTRSTVEEEILVHTYLTSSCLVHRVASLMIVCGPYDYYYLFLLKTFSQLNIFITLYFVQVFSEYVYKHLQNQCNRGLSHHVRCTGRCPLTYSFITT